MQMSRKFYMSIVLLSLDEHQMTFRALWKLLYHILMQQDLLVRNLQMETSSSL